MDMLKINVRHGSEKANEQAFCYYRIGVHMLIVAAHYVHTLRVPTNAHVCISHARKHLHVVLYELVIDVR